MPHDFINHSPKGRVHAGCSFRLSARASASDHCSQPLRVCAPFQGDPAVHGHARLHLAPSDDFMPPAPISWTLIAEARRNIRATNIYLSALNYVVRYRLLSTQRSNRNICIAAARAAGPERPYPVAVVVPWGIGTRGVSRHEPEGRIVTLSVPVRRHERRIYPRYRNIRINSRCDRCQTAKKHRGNKDCLHDISPS